MQPILSVHNIRKAFGSKVAVNDVSFTVKKGEIFGLLGPNGAGKTTAIRIIMGIIEADRGQVSFTINGNTTGIQKSAIGYLPEERGLYGDAPVVDTLVYLAGLKGVSPAIARQDALSWLERLDLREYAKQKLEKLSKGMQQKVQFVAAVLHKPDLLMLDEPFSGLDPVNQDFFREIIADLSKNGTTILFSAHQMNLVEELCDSIIMINNGRPVLAGDLEQIKQSYKERVIQVTFSDKKYSQFPTISGMTLDYDNGKRASLRYTGTESAEQIISQLTNLYAIDEVSVKKPPLHDIFVNTVRERGGELA